MAALGHTNVLFTFVRVCFAASRVIMPSFCCVVGCGSRGERDKYSFHCIPSVLNFKHKLELNKLSKLRREKWLLAIKREDLTNTKIKNAKVCGKHFISGTPAELTDSSNPDWIPSLNMGYNVHRDDAKRKTAERYARLSERNAKILMSNQQEAGTSSSASPSELPLNTVDEEGVDSSSVSNCTSTQTDLTMDNLTTMFLDLSATITIDKKLKSLVVTCESLKGDDNKCKYYTGFQSSVLEIVVEDLQHFVPMHHNTKLAATEQILLTFMKLRLNLDFKDLAFRFQISPTVASTYFKTVISIMFQRFQGLVSWPSREELCKTMPQCFKESFHDKTSIILDCFEIFIETPADPYAAAQCWSNYKHHSTVKYLIGITPQGSVSFISNGWGGRVSDKFLTIQSDFLDLLHPGDVVLADRGFLIKDFVELFKATVKTPAFTKGKTQLHPVDLENSRSIASVRIHVERVIGVIRQKYRILTGVMPMSTASSGCLDEIVFVCCALLNLCPGVVPLD